MLGTLAVQEAMGMKVDREAVATLVLPQLWAMSIGPLINVNQFQRFMDVIKTLGARVEKEHVQFLKDSQRIEDRSAVNGFSSVPASMGANVDFESLVSSTKSHGTTNSILSDKNGTDDDIWGSILSSTSVQSPSPAPLQPNQWPTSVTSMPTQTASLFPPTSFPAGVLPNSSHIPTQASRLPSFGVLPSSSQPTYNSGFTPLQPPQSQPSAISHGPSIPNYNIQLPPSNVNLSPPPQSISFNSVLSPSAAPKPFSNVTKKQGNAWDAFDPLA